MKRSVVACLALVVLACATPCAARGIDHPRTPNILFVIMDDVGIDQMRLFGYGGTPPPSPPRTHPNPPPGNPLPQPPALPARPPPPAGVFTRRRPLRHDPRAL